MIGLLGRLGLAMAAIGASAGGAPWKRHVIDDSSRGADGVRLADANGDGRPDVATAWEEGGRVRVYLHPGKDKVRERWPAVTVGRVADGEDAVLADLDGDGAVDVVSCCEGATKRINAHWAPREKGKVLDEAEWKTEAFPASLGKRWMFCLPLQVDGRRGIDLVVGAKDQGAEIGWLESPENPRDLGAWTWHALYDAGWIMSLHAADLDGDGDPDLLASDRKGKKTGCLWLENPGPGEAQARPWTEHRIGGTRETLFIVPADLDRDGRLDVVAAAPRQLFFMRRKEGTPPAWEEFPIALPASAGTGKGVNVADIDLDGKPDLVFSCENAAGKSGVQRLSYRAAATDRDWEAHDISGSEGIKFDLVALVDLDGDGDLDVLTTEERTPLGVVWYENPAR